MGKMLTGGNSPVALVLVVGIVLGIACNLWNGILVVKLKVFPFIITLASQYIFEGLSYIISNSTTSINFPASFKYIGQGYIGGGMLPKLNNCIDAIENGVSRVHILDGRILHCLLLEIFTNKGIGTAILGEGEGKYYHEEQ